MIGYRFLYLRGGGGAIIFTMYGSSSLAFRVFGFLKQFGWIYDGDDDTRTLVCCDFFNELYSCKCHQNSDEQRTMSQSIGYW